MKLVIIEGPGKRDTIQKYLGKDYEVIASKGHVRDLPVHTLGVDMHNHFEPKYELMPDKKDVIKLLKNKSQKAEKVLLATDPDREGEAISWHIAYILGLNPEDNVRIEFNEISKNAINKALEAPRKINLNLVHAQQARRVLDRIVGYKLSPVISKKIQPKLSAGRVQSVALKLVVDREREIINFKPEESWIIQAELSKISPDDIHFNANLHSFKGEKIKLQNAQQKDEVLSAIKSGNWIVQDVRKSVTHSHAPAPYITSTMQQDALNKLGMSLKRTTAAAQNLYEGVEVPGKGKTALITYIRTDSVRVSPEAQARAKEFIISNFGEKYYPEKPNIYNSKKSAQDAHEAIRPIYMDIHPDDVKSISPDNYKLYKLIYERFLASQMADATYNSVSLDVGINDYMFRATGRTPIFAGYTAVYQEYQSKDDSKEDDATSRLPDLLKDEKLICHNLKPEQKFTKPPARYTEASLVKAMEEKGIGRPATYAPTILVLTNREYVVKDGKYLKPSELGCKVTDTLVKYFPDIMDVAFTANMETQLDEIADGEMEWQDVIDRFYKDFEKALIASNDGQYAAAEETDEICDKCGSKMVIRTGKYGRFLACSNYPECKNVKNFTEHDGQLKVSDDEATDEICDKCGHPMVVRVSKYGKFLACSNYPDCKNIRSLAVSVGKCPKCGNDIIEKISKKGNKFYGCSNYPKCDFVAWDKPTGKKCPNCGGILVKKEGKTTSKIYCINSACGYSKTEKKLESTED